MLTAAVTAIEHVAGPCQNRYLLTYYVGTFHMSMGWQARIIQVQ